MYWCVYSICVLSMINYNNNDDNDNDNDITRITPTITFTYIESVQMTTTCKVLIDSFATKRKF